MPLTRINEELSALAKRLADLAKQSLEIQRKIDALEAEKAQIVKDLRINETMIAPPSQDAPER